MRNYDSYKNFVIVMKIFRLLSHFQGIIGIIRSYSFQKKTLVNSEGYFKFR